jgi:hypothetical protein
MACGFEVGDPPINELQTFLESIQRELPRRDRRVAELLAKQPEWFQKLSTDAGVAAAELRLGCVFPESLRLFYRFPALGCRLLADQDTDIFLQDYPQDQQPHLVEWYARKHLVLAEFSSSQTVCAVELNIENPRIEWGDDGARRPFDLPPKYFVEWLLGIAADS